MFPPPEEAPGPAAPRGRLGWNARLGLAAAVLLLSCVYGLAAWLDPFDAAGQPRRSGTHEQLGLGPCQFEKWTGKPCPTCGMTTAFSLLMHGRPVAAARANPAGLLLALAGVPLAVGLALAAAKGRWQGPKVPETWLLPLAAAVFGFVMLVWLTRLALAGPG